MLPITLLLVTPAGLLTALAVLCLSPARKSAQWLVRPVAFAVAAASLSAVVAFSVTGAGTITLGLPGVDLLYLRADLVSITLTGLVGFVGAIVLSFSGEYLDGEARQGRFLAWLSMLLASVMMFVASGHLLQLLVCWLLTSLFLHKLLLFYPDRPGARRAARKKVLFARASDLLLISASLLLWQSYGTGDILQINTAAREAEAAGTSPVIFATVFLALAAILKSAQFPFHGWLTEVMETPTPVSAMLHAGVINAGGFLLIRFADVMLLSPGVLAFLVMIGGFTALFGGLVMLVQPAVKTSLAWSTISQMGFMILQCGLALFPLALLHIVLHSLYKAHAFLSSGDAVKQVASIHRPGPIAIPDLRAVGLAFAAAILIYAATALLMGLDGKSPQAIALGAILVFGVAYMLAQGLADRAPKALALYTAGYAVAVTVAYFALQTLSAHLAGETLPQTPAPGPLEWALLCLALASFALTAFAQATFPLWTGHPAVRGLRVHLFNGLYVNTVWDRLLGNWQRNRHFHG